MVEKGQSLDKYEVARILLECIQLNNIEVKEVLSGISIVMMGIFAATNVTPEEVDEAFAAIKEDYKENLRKMKKIKERKNR